MTRVNYGEDGLYIMYDSSLFQHPINKREFEATPDAPFLCDIVRLENHDEAKGIASDVLKVKGTKVVVILSKRGNVFCREWDSSLRPLSK